MATQEEVMILEESINLALRSLSPREERVLRLYYGLGTNKHTLKEIGDIQGGVTKERIRQLRITAERKLRHPKRHKYLLDTYLTKKSAPG